MSLPASNRLGKVVPALPPIDGIKDQQTRAFLQAIADGWATRNGQRGSGENRFLTEADLKGIDFTKLGNLSLPRVIVPGSNGGGPLPHGVIAGLINDLAAQIYESPLFKFLGERIDFIDKPTTGIIDRMGASEIGLATEKEQRVNADNAINTEIVTRFAATDQSLAVIQLGQTTLTNGFSALATQVTTVQASIGQNSTAIQQEATARANADGELYSQYTVKIDSNGYVSGFGLASTVNNAQILSEFYIRADRFAIASPVVPHALGTPPPPANIPFIVQSTPWHDSGGNLQPAGVYMKTAFIDFAWIDQGNITNAAVGTLQLAGQAVTLPFGGTDANARSMNGGDYVAIAALPINNNDSATVIFFVDIVASFSPGSGGSGNFINFELTLDTRNNVQMARSVGYPNNIGFMPMPASGTIAVPPGNHTLVVWAQEAGSDINTFGTMQSCTIVAIGLKR